MNSLCLSETSASHIENKEEHQIFCQFITPPKKQSEPEVQSFSQSVDTLMMDIDKQEQSTSEVIKGPLEQEFDKAPFLNGYEDDSSEIGDI